MSVTLTSNEKNIIKSEWAKLSISDIQSRLKEKGLSFKLSKKSNRHFVIKGVVVDVSLYATTGTVSINKSSKVKLVANETLSPQAAFDKLALLAQTRK